MPPNSEIEKLERRWKENPKGTVFAPYAEVLRKNGDVPLATEVLRQGLELHPDHIPGNIVLGRCQLDLGEDGPAEAAFTHVLDLDVENVIALKALGDITERQGRLMEASNWLERLISVDPSNDEARDQLARILDMREAAAAAITRPVEILVRSTPPAEPPLPPPAPVIQPATPAALRSEADSGQIDNDPLTDDAAIDSVLDSFGPPLEVRAPVSPPVDDEDRTVPSIPVLSRPVVFEDDERTVPSIPVFSAPPPLDLEPAALDLAAAAAEIESAPLDAIEIDEPFVVPARDMLLDPIATDAGPGADINAGGVFSIGTEEVPPIDLRPSGMTEFQEPDDSEALLEMTPGKSEFQVPDDSAALLEMTPGKSEFQVPNASEELTLSSGGATEYQTPSGVDELLNVTTTGSAEFQPPSGVDELLASAGARAEAEEPAASEPEPVVPPVAPRSWGGGVVTSGFAAIALMPTEELPTDSRDAAAPPVPPISEVPTAFMAPYEPERESFAESEPAPASADAGEVLEDGPADSELLIEEMSSEAGALEMVAVEPTADFEAPVAETVEPVDASPPSELRLIFPDDSNTVEPPKIHRISEEYSAPRMTAEAEPAEPAPVLTETMAELYARQGHFPEALAVYRQLVARQPGDHRLTERMRELEALEQAGARRMSYVAMDTGGESVESFFRALVEARPMGGGSVASTSMEPEDGSGAPTRPASDPLSLSAIFGEEASSPPAPPSEPTAAPGGADAFSFDQFFGGPTPGPGGSSHPRSPGPGGEDLDQFQHWLKSLKR